MQTRVVLRLRLDFGCCLCMECSNSGQSKAAFVTFRDPKALEIALVLPSFGPNESGSIGSLVQPCLFPKLYMNHFRLVVSKH
ncbi:unnamed protein product [Ilex paraguariensis]|uniref:Uncharacterized protein n=1 Tax=Ilex paraguariensis TaxID=185542 RepID=A0ABC8T922_9AQUA